MDRNHPNKLDSDSSFILDTVPRVVNFLPRENNLQVKAFQCSAFPARIVEAIHSNDIPRNLVLGATQWRLDFPRPKKLINDERVKAALSVAESLLTRGSTPYCLPRRWPIGRSLVGRSVFGDLPV